MQNGKVSLKVSKDIELKLPEIAFAGALFAVVDEERNHLRNWLSWVDETKELNHIREFLRTSRLLNQGGQRLTTFIFKSNLVIGSIGLVKIDKAQQSGEIGYWLRASYQGKGVMTKACKRLIDYTFKTMEINRLEIKVAAPNHKSQAIPKRLGFYHEATLREALRLYERFYDLELYSLLRKDWEKWKDEELK